LQDELLRSHAATKKTVLLVTHSIDEAVYLADEVVAIAASPAVLRLSRRSTFPAPAAAAMFSCDRFKIGASSCTRITM
jgi:NitT/TauT family transport system ATP-binding protein